MKGVIILGAILAVLGASIWWFVMHESMKDQGCWIAVAFGNDDDANIEMHTLVDIMMVTKDRPDVDAKGEPMWNEWVQAHFELRDAAGEVVPGVRMGWSSLVNDDKSMAVPEFYVKYPLKKGEKYTYDYVPFTRVAKPGHYQYSFTAPKEPQKLQRNMHELVTK